MANLMWQIESNNGWSYEIGDFKESITLSLSGPTLYENGWFKLLKPGEKFETIKCALTLAESFDKAVANLTLYRRHILSPYLHKCKDQVIFNEYMFASWNRPSDETARQLAPVAAELGAEYYVIDCGWHDEEEDPFYYLGKWKASAAKYKDGLEKTAEFVRSLGLKLGLWLEPEVVGLLGDAKSHWPRDVF